MGVLLDGSTTVPVPDGAFGPFQGVEQIATGATGPVFRARQKGTDRVVAIKLFTNAIAADRTRAAVSELERLVAAPLNHPAIVKPLAAGIFRESPYLVQEYVPGEALDVLLRSGRAVPAADVMRWATQIAGALDFAAVVRIHHGALNLRNVLIDRGDAHVIGFGVAEALKRAGSAGAAVDRPSDVASLARVVHQLLCRRPVAGSARDALIEIGAQYGSAARGVFARALGDRSGPPFETALSFVAALMPAVANASEPRRFDAVDLPLAAPQGAPRSEPRAGTAQRTVRRAKPATATAARWPALTIMLMLGVAIGAAGERALLGRSAAVGPHATIAQQNSDRPAAAATGTSGNAAAADALRKSGPASASAAPGREPSGSNRSSAPPRPRPDAAQPDRTSQTATISSDTPVSAGTMLYVDSAPRGATLYLDDKFFGTTPVAVPVAEGGDHMLRLERAGSLTWSSPVHVQPNRLNRVMVALEEP